ncbi:MAG: FAD-dependent oxidoreductase [Candidatus Rokubacteria bacterium]|nr:FAD-dependent oxidoreductase [Candidatus Rokubacteria bacterium]
MRSGASARDVVVIGGGVVGVATAYYLGRRGAAVTVVEKGEVAAGASYGNAGLVVPSHSVPLPHPGVLAQGLRFMLDRDSPFYVQPRLDRDLARWLWAFRRCCTDAHVRRAVPVIRDLSQASLALFADLASRFDFGFRHDGLLVVYRSERGLDDGRHEARVLEAAGIVAKLVDGAAARALEPSLRPDIAGAVLFPDDAHVTPDRFVRGLARVAEGLGVTIRTHAEVLGFRTGGRRIRAVETTTGDVACDEVVLATGSWSPALGRALDLTLPIQPAKGYSVTYEQPADGPRLPMLLVESRVAVTPMRTERGGWLRFGGTLELAGLDLSINRRRVEAITRGARQHLNLPADLPLVEIWRGLRPCTPDGLPMIGRTRRWENLVVATGHAMIGLSLGPVTGSLVAELLAGQPPSIDLAPLDPDRFAR